MSSGFYYMIGETGQFFQLHFAFSQAAQDGTSAGGSQVYRKEISVFHVSVFDFKELIVLQK